MRWSIIFDNYVSPRHYKTKKTLTGRQIIDLVTQHQVRRRTSIELQGLMREERKGKEMRVQ